MSECYLCGKRLIRRVNRTKDHVPPDSFFPAGTQNMITVPCCYRCNQEFKPLDDKIRNHMASLITMPSTPISKGHRAVLNSPRLAREYLSYTKKHPTLVGKDGKPILVYFFNKEEINRWLIRIVKGLHYYKYGFRIDDNAIFKATVHSNIRPLISESVPMEDGLERRPYFVYALVKDDKDRNLDCWVLVFYDKVIFSIEVEHKG